MEKKFATDIVFIGCIFRIYKEVLQSNMKKKKTTEISVGNSKKKKPKNPMKL